MQRQQLQEEEYARPYHHLVSFNPFKAHEYLSWGLEYFTYVSAVMDMIPQENLKRLAEVGCGDGKITLELARRFPNVVCEGFDISRRAILFAQAYGYGIRNLSFYAQDFSSTEKDYDVIVCVETLEHISQDDLSSFVSSLRAKTRRFVVMSVPTVNVPLNPKHYRHYDISLLEKHMEGFRLIKSEYVCTTTWFSRLLDLTLANRLFIARTGYVIRPVLRLYNKYCKRGSATTGTHIVALFERIG